MELLCILWYRIVLHVIALYRMVLHGIVLYLTVLHGIALLGSARGLYLARHLSTLWFILQFRTCGTFLVINSNYVVGIGDPLSAMSVFSIFNKKKTSLSVQIDHISPPPFLATLVALHFTLVSQ